jgi:hypothetical protein
MSCRIYSTPENRFTRRAISYALTPISIVEKLRLCTIRGQARALNGQEPGNHHRRGDVMAALLLNANEGVQFGLADINRVH